jgi:hypothetical protein
LTGESKPEAGSEKRKQDLEGIASDVVEAQLDGKYDNKTKAIVARAIAGALIEIFEPAKESA